MLCAEPRPVKQAVDRRTVGLSVYVITVPNYVDLRTEPRSRVPHPSSVKSGLAEANAMQRLLLTLIPTLSLNVGLTTALVVGVCLAGPDALFLRSTGQ